jgi:murein DD-endopeptidase MepM/ murein hydrolase activator NlpD
VSAPPIPSLVRPSAAEPAGDAARREQAAIAAREFEALFLLQMLKQMRQSMLDEEAEEPGLGADVMFDTIDAELARHLAGSRGGLAPMLESAFGGAPRVQPVSPAASRAAAVAAPGAAHTPAAGKSAESEDRAPHLELLSGRISSKFGRRADPFSGEGRFHRGVDIAAAYGREVPAAAAGRVVSAGTQGGYGHTVVLEHEDGVRTRYAHLSQIDVSEGDTVQQGGLVGRVGKSGRATGPHLHFEVLQGDVALDPARWAGVTRVSAKETDD